MQLVVAVKGVQLAVLFVMREEIQSHVNVDQHFAVLYRIARMVSKFALHAQIVAVILVQQNRVRKQANSALVFETDRHVNVKKFVAIFHHVPLVSTKPNVFHVHNVLA